MSPENELLRFKVPEIEEVEVVFIRLEDGTIVARTKEELEKAEGKEEGEEGSVTE